MDRGNAANEWRFSDRQYRSTETGEICDWDEWLKWRGTTNCAAVSKSGVDGTATLTIVGGLLTTAAIAAGGSGGDAKSPGWIGIFAGLTGEYLTSKAVSNSIGYAR